jgi:hypothetical protein
VGLKKYGIPSSSAAVHGFRYNARVLAEHLATTHFGVKPLRRSLDSGEVVDVLLEEATHAPELWNQQSYLARQVTVEADGSIVDGGIVPLQHFVDASGPDSLAITTETDDTHDIHPALYVRRNGRVDEHLLAGDVLLDFRGADQRAHVMSVLKGWVT